ncbi:hypothetical protein BRADI_4g12165v3 [Brachypodium distachyon]|uniref:Uncharacterized protein n=1 Tax=Brachypodium distachyon TaxID=15368 RepID=A0A2K2CM96_BRADI|nr:hypothetical protein BRADI_4g12165v3 [Brachypodium distachyon]
MPRPARWRPPATSPVESGHLGCLPRFPVLLDSGRRRCRGPLLLDSGLRRRSAPLLLASSLRQTRTPPLRQTRRKLRRRLRASVAAPDLPCVPADPLPLQFGVRFGQLGFDLGLIWGRRRIVKKEK